MTNDEWQFDSDFANQPVKEMSTSKHITFPIYQAAAYLHMIIIQTTRGLKKHRFTIVIQGILCRQGIIWS